MKNTTVKLGLIAGIIVSALMLVNIRLSTTIETSFDLGQVIGYGSMLAAFSTIFIGIKKIRDEQNEGFISFKQAFKIGAIITFIASAFYVITWMIFSGGEAAELMMDEYFAEALEKIQNSMESDESKQAQIEKMERMKSNYGNPFFKALVTLMEIFPIGIIVSLIAAFILKRTE